MPKQTVEQRLQIEIEKVEDKIRKLQQQEAELNRDRERLAAAKRAIEES